MSPLVSESPSPHLDVSLFRRAMGRFPTSITIAASMLGGRPVGTLVSTLIPVSIDPPMVAYCVSLEDDAATLLADASSVSLSVLPHTALATYRRFSGVLDDRFRHDAWHESEWGTPVLDSSVTTLHLSGGPRVPAGDHLLVLSDVLNVVISAPTEPPLTIFGGRATRLDAGEVVTGGRWGPVFQRS
jgi:3-hydroxy-9,10-secoandrosta-1,3,5(10)-triene-9,17-dione monooxygenase reductase component